MKADFFEDDFWSGNDLEALYRDLRESASDPFSNVFCSAMAEWERLTSKGRIALNAIESKIERIMQITIKKEVEDIEKNMTFLSTLGTNGVIIGILGMVVSIMDGMKTIALSQSAGMAAVAPILSESLFTTALGVFAAIPAAIAYNKLSSDINKYIERLETFSEEFTSIIARQIEDE
jgi:biopolymer transport protein TolQ